MRAAAGWRSRSPSGRWARGCGPRGSGAGGGGVRLDGCVCVCVQRARTDEANAGGSHSEAEEDDEDYVPYVPLRQRRQLLVRGPRGVTAGSEWTGVPGREPGHLGRGPDAPGAGGDFSCRSCCSGDARGLRTRSSRTAAASPGPTRTTSRWARSPTSACWTSTSTSRRKPKVGVGWAGAGTKPGTHRRVVSV